MLHQVFNCSGPSCSVPNPCNPLQLPSRVAALFPRGKGYNVLPNLAGQMKQFHNLCNPRPTESVAPGNLSPIVSHPGLQQLLKLMREGKRMPVRLSTFLRNIVFCPPFQAFWAKRKPREKVPTVIRIGESSIEC